LGYNLTLATLKPGTPDNIARYFGIRWTDGTTTLLTWAGSGTTALDEKWVADYRQSVATSPVCEIFPMPP
jgi:hypothetical protein